MCHDNNNAVIAQVEPLTIPTYREPAAEQLPMFAENRVHQRTSGNPYPCRVVVKTDRRPPQEKTYQAIRLENEYIRLIILPELGGRIFAATDKTTGYDFFYRQHVIKPALIGVLGSWISGGVEFNWPFHHRPSTFMPVDYAIERREDGETIVWLSEHDPIERMKGMVGISLCPGQTLIKTHMKVFNRTPVTRSFLWWENAAVPVNEQYQIFFPPDVRYVNFHYHLSVTTFPVATGVFNGIRMGEGTDITWHRNTRAPTSYFSAPSRQDFFGGYDHGRGCGVVHVADRHTAPGKKMFTWAYNQLARSWERALTDTDGAYAELMAGSYSDNQPDFAWLAPYETKEFEQCWYPIAGTGTLTAANRLLALGLQRHDGQIELRILATRRLDGVRLTVQTGEAGSDNREQLVRDLMLSAGQTSALTMADPGAPLHIRIVQADQTLLAYTESSVGSAPLPESWQDLPAPRAEHSAQDLYLLGLHVKQYRDPCVAPDAYWQEALQRDPEHAPTLVALGESEYQRGNYETAQDYLARARRVLTRHNGNPEDGRVFYLLGLVYQAQDQLDQASDALAKAAWNQAQTAAALTRLASLDGRRGDYARMLAHSRTALDSAGQNGLAQALAAIALERTGNRPAALVILAQALAADPLNHLARLLDCLYREQPLEGFVCNLHGDRGQTALDLAFELIAAGQADIAANLLLITLKATKSGTDQPMVAYTLASLLPADTAAQYLDLARSARKPGRFPSRLEELAVLQQITASRPDDANAWYLLGCLLYSKRRYAEAADCWTRCLSLEPGFAAARRNLAIAGYSHLDRRDETLPLLQEAYRQNPADEQLFYEICHVLARTGADPLERIAFIAGEAERRGLDCFGRAAAAPGNDEKPALRPEIVLEWCQALNQSGQWAEALDLLAAHRFIPCEGGEHAVAEQYLFANHALGRQLLVRHDPAAALARFRQAQQLPDNLGAGLWHEAWLVPHQYYEAICLEQLGQPAAARLIYEHIVGLTIDYFSNMHLPGLPCWQALALLRLGRAEDARQALQTAETRWQQALRQPDAGYFKATPFFISYMEQPQSLRRGLYWYLIGFAQAVRGDPDAARNSWQESQAADPGLLFCRLEAELLNQMKGGEEHEQ